jgi:hypothetical protein
VQLIIIIRTHENSLLWATAHKGQVLGSSSHPSLLIMSGEIPPILLLLIIRTQELLASHSVRTPLTPPLGLCVTLCSFTLVFFPPSYEMPHYSSEITIPLPPCPDILLSPFYRRCNLCEELVNVCLSCIFLFTAQKCYIF